MTTNNKVSLRVIPQGCGDDTHLANGYVYCMFRELAGMYTIVHAFNLLVRVSWELRRLRKLFKSILLTYGCMHRDVAPSFVPRLVLNTRMIGFS